MTAASAAGGCKSDLLQALIGTSLVVLGVRMMCLTSLAQCTAAPPSIVVAKGEPSANRSAIRCLPVAHDVLWKRLRLVVADLDNFRTTDSIDLSSASLNNDSQEPPPRALAAGDSPSDQGQTSKELRGLPETLPLEESNRIPDDATTPHSPHQDLHPRLNRLLNERKVRGLRRNKRLHRRRRKLMTDIFRKTSWHCHMSKYWKRMPPGIFPPYVQTARCRQRSCMLGMFECRPRRYRIKLLRKNDGVCNPLPTTAAAQTDYEETWIFVEYKVVVGCECSKKHGAGSYSRHDQTVADTSRRRLEVVNNS